MQKWIVLPDLQIPFEDHRTLAAVEAFMKDVQASDEPFTGWLQLGDLLDFDELSRYHAGEEGSVATELQESYEGGNRFLDRHQKIMRAGCKSARFVLLEGNHDYRAYDCARKDDYKKFRGYLNYETMLNLKDRGIKWVRSWKDGKTFQLGKANFTHGIYTNQYHAKKMVQNFGTNIYYGHLHDVMEMPQIQRGNDKTMVGKSLGCLCDYNQSYLKGRPTNWQQAFAIFYIFPDGNFTEHTIRIFKHRFHAYGKTYDGSKILKY
jgi:hypothetical protein